MRTLEEHFNHKYNFLAFHFLNVMYCATEFLIPGTSHKGTILFFFRKPKTRGMSAGEAVSKAREGVVTVIDVREHGEVQASGKAGGALNIPLTRLRDMADPRHPDFFTNLESVGTIALYCASGARSSRGKMILTKLGYEDVHNIGSLRHWVKAGGAVEPA